MKQEMKNYEIKMWEAAKNKDKQAYLDVVSKDAVMVCGGYRCSGAEYAQIIDEFDCKEYQMDDFEIVCQTPDVIQVHYMITTTVNDERNQDLAGCFHVTTTWKKIDQVWKVVFNMDQRVERR